MSRSDFTEVFCARHSVPRANFERSVLRRALYPHARLLAPLCHLFKRNYFAADLDFIRAVVGYHPGHNFSTDAMDFSDHPSNQGFWRRTLRVRVSARRLFKLVRKTMPLPLEAHLIAPESYGEI